MGILAKHLHLLSLEKKVLGNNYIFGNTLVLGQQATYITFKDLKSLFISHGLNIEKLPHGFDKNNKIPQWIGTDYDKNTNVQAVLTLLGANKVSVTDISSYEKPDIILDLNKIVEEKYFNNFDTIFDIGSLEHIFDTYTAFSNLIRMTKVGGRVIFILPASNSINHGFYSFSPTFFYDFFESNGFKDCRIFFLEGNPFDYFRKGKIFKYHRSDIECPFVTNNGVEIYFSAVKKDDVKKIIKPIQSIYKKSAYWSSTETWENVLTKRQKIKFVIKKLSRILPTSLFNWIYLKIKRKGLLTYVGKY